MDWFWDLFNSGMVHRALNDANLVEGVARSAVNEGQRAEKRIHHLEEQTERLSLAVMALAEILRDELHVSEATIEAKLQAIDARDGKLDGKLSRPAKCCGSCQRVNNSNRVSCLYCGTQLPPESSLFCES